MYNRSLGEASKFYSGERLTTVHVAWWVRVSADFTIAAAAAAAAETPSFSASSSPDSPAVAAAHDPPTAPALGVSCWCSYDVDAPCWMEAVLERASAVH